MKDFIIYEKGKTKVYILKCLKIPKGKKLPIYLIRRDDNTGYGHLLAIISFNGRWRQYITKFEPNTEWSASCKEQICIFENRINYEWRQNLNRNI